MFNYTITLKYLDGPEEVINQNIASGRVQQTLSSERVLKWAYIKLEHIIFDIQDNTRTRIPEEVVFPTGQKFHSENCSVCHRFIVFEPTHRVEVANERVCSSCQRDYHRCACCLTWTLRTELTTRGFSLCPRCSPSYHVCTNCGCWIANTDEQPLCSRCRDREQQIIRERLINQHGCKKPPIFFPPTTTTAAPLLYLGAEIEVDCCSRDQDEYYQLAEDIISISKEETLCYVEHDSSLEHGLEIVTRPHTLAKYKVDFPYDALFDILHGRCRADDTITCGLHIHASNKFFGQALEFAQLKLLFLFERFWKHLFKISRRKQEQIDTWASRYGLVPTLDIRGRNLIQQIKAGRTNRYRALNLLPSTTTEFRLFQGTIIPARFLAALEFVDFICRLVQEKEPVELQELTWPVIRGTIENDERYQMLGLYIRECEGVSDECVS